MSELEQRLRDTLRDPSRELPAWPDPMPRIRQAARGQRARLAAGGSAGAAGAAVAAVAIVISLAAPPVSPRHAQPPGTACAPPSAGLGSVVYVSGRSLHEVNLGTRISRVLVRDGGSAIAMQAPAYSHDGRWVAFGNASVVSSSGGKVTSILGRTQVNSWAWSATNDKLAAVTSRSGVVIGGPGLSPRTVLPTGWGATGAAFSPCSHALAVSRYPYVRSLAQRRRADKGIWVIDVRNGRAREVYKVPGGMDLAPQLAGWSPDGRWILFQLDPGSAASIGADGLPLEAVLATGRARPVQVVPIEVSQPLAWCENTLVQSAGAIRFTFQGKHLIAAQAPKWIATAATRAPPLGWMLPRCSDDGRWVAVTAAPTSSKGYPTSFIQPAELWLLRPDGAQPHVLIGNDGGRYQLTPLGWSGGSRWLLVQRMRLKPGTGPAELLLAEVSEGGRLVKLTGPVATARLSLSTAPLVDGQLVLPYGWYRP
jgi:hypothetical protein